MTSLSAFDLLAVWEQGLRLHPLDRGLLLLGAGTPSVPYENLADWPLGRRNRVLAEMRCAAFGPRMEAWTTCAECGEKLEIEINAGMIANGTTDANGGEDEVVMVNGRSYRLPTGRDLARATAEVDAQRAAARILEACRIDAGESWEWSQEEQEEVGQQMALADPMAEILIDIRCPICGHESSETFDISTFFWEELEARAKRILGEIHALASAYGWTEREVLSLSDNRRAMYVEMVRG